MYTSIYDVPTGRYPREVAWLKRLHRDGALICSVCSGALLLAETGLLNGHSATAHWAYRDMFQRNYPKITFRNESVLCLERSEEHTSELQSLMRISYAVFCLKKQKNKIKHTR